VYEGNGAHGPVAAEWGGAEQQQQVEGGQVGGGEALGQGRGQASGVVKLREHRQAPALRPASLSVWMRASRVVGEI
jgi:hypothetical protein